VTEIPDAGHEGEARLDRVILPRALHLLRCALALALPASILLGASDARADVSPAQAKLQVAEIATWEVSMQETTCSEPSLGDAGAMACPTGGVRELATGPTFTSPDNTAEAIFVWSYEEQLSGDVSYGPNTAAAFSYLAASPGVIQGNGYPPAYVCGWVLRAVVEYEAATGDLSHHAFGADCADEVEADAPGLATSGASLMNAGAAAWAASGLWTWGDANADEAAKSAAASIGGEVKTWIEAAPATTLTMQEWAFTGGTTFYGVVGSYMNAHPAELAAWVATYAPMLGGWIDESTPVSPEDYTDWRNAFNAWNMAAQTSAARALGTVAGAANQQIAADILDRLVAQELPGAGAIPGSQQRPATEAQSWITAYLVYFGLRETIDEATADAGAGTPTTGATGTVLGGAGCGVGGGGGGPSGAMLLVIVVVVGMASRRRRPGTAGRTRGP
jgi:MYXO-CTERM domain-containing protein